MKNIRFAVLFCISAIAVLGAPRTWRFGDGTILTLNLPGGTVCEQISPPADTENQAFTLRLPDVNSASTISYQFIVRKSDSTIDWSTEERVTAFLIKAGEKGRSRSVEKQLSPIPLKMKHGVGAYLVFTDPELVGKQISRPGTYRHMTMVACSVSGFAIFVRGYTNSTKEYYFTRMNQIIEGAEISLH